MNFKAYFLLVISTFLCGCGVKAPPLEHPETSIDSYMSSYTGEPVPALEKKEVPPKPAQ